MKAEGEIRENTEQQSEEKLESGVEGIERNVKEGSKNK